MAPSLLSKMSENNSQDRACLTKLSIKSSKRGRSMGPRSIGGSSCSVVVFDADGRPAASVPFVPSLFDAVVAAVLSAVGGLFASRSPAAAVPALTL